MLKNNKTFYSQQGEDLLIFRNFINNKISDGIFVELGACNGLLYSNTLFFQQELGFNGILIEPIKEMYDKLIINRPKCICYNNAISSNKQDVEFFVNGPVSGIKSNMKDSYINNWHKNSNIRKIKTQTLSKIFKDQKIKYIDFFSLDVEGGELDVLKTIDWGDINIYLICIELDDNNPKQNDECRKILIDNGFEFKIKMCINEFWVNPKYERRNMLYDSSKKDTFTGNMRNYGRHVYLEPHCRPEIEKTIYEFENK